MGTINDNIYIDGHLTAKTMGLAAGTVNNSSISAGAAIDVDKMDSAIHTNGTNFTKAIDELPVDREEIMGAVKRAGTIRGFHAVLNTVGTGGGTASQFDLQVNASTGAATQIAFTTSDASGTIKSASINTPALSAGDRLSIELTVGTVGTSLGPYAWIEWAEDF